MPRKRETGEDYLVYRYKVLLEEKRHPNGYKYMDYANAKAVFEKVSIDTKERALKLK